MKSIPKIDQKMTHQYLPSSIKNTQYVKAGFLTHLHCSTWWTMDAPRNVVKIFWSQKYFFSKNSIVFDRELCNFINEFFSSLIFTCKFWVIWCCFLKECMNFNVFWKIKITIISNLLWYKFNNKYFFVRIAIFNDLKHRLECFFNSNKSFNKKGSIKIQYFSFQLNSQLKSNTFH